MVETLKSSLRDRFHYLTGVVVLICVVLINTFVWWKRNQPLNPLESAYPLRSLSLNPFQKNQSPFDHDQPSPADLEHDFAHLEGKTQAVRLYSSTGFMAPAPEIAQEHDMKLIAGAWLGNGPEEDEKEFQAAVSMAGRNHNVVRLLIGNETQLNHRIPQETLVAYLREARTRLRTPVSTAEPWDYWLNNPEMVDEVDFITIHILPYWLEEPIDRAVDYVIGKYRAVHERFPYKPILIGETGWPSEGPQRGAAVPSVANQARFVRDFINWAEAEKINYNIIEAFDQPWKSGLEGTVGEYWGIMNADRQNKFPLQGPVLNDPNWKWWALSASMLGAFSIALYFFRRPALRVGGQIFSATIIQAVGSVAVLIAREASDQYMSPGDIVFWTCMIGFQVLLAIIFVTDAAEVADVIGERPLERRYRPAQRLPNSEYPKVSIHLASCKEPPEMVILTLDSLSQLDYPDFEVIVVDNNTPDEALWKPIEAHCKKLGAHFRFFSLGKWPGYKAGALNFALKQTDPLAQIVAVVDADYVVENDWLFETVPYFKDQAVAVVQAPQEHRDYRQSLFRQMENDEYSGFFRIGMVQRNEENAIIQHGTMTLVRRADLDNVGGWAEWCICEDAELGLRLFLAGKSAVYIDHAFGHGLVPDTYTAYTKQRFRWAYGAMRITRRYWRELLGLRKGLTVAQRYQFVKGWLPWIGDGLHMLFTVAAVAWSALLIFNPLETEFPEPIFIYPAMALVGLRLVGTALTYTARVHIGAKRTFLAMIAGGALTHTIAKAVLQGLTTSGVPFHRTPKLAGNSKLLKAVAMAREELFLAVLLFALAITIRQIYGPEHTVATLWMIGLSTQAIPYVCSVALATISGLTATPQKAINLSELPPSKAAVG